LQFTVLGPIAAQHLEGSYISRSSLTRSDLVEVHPLWCVDNGSTSLERSVHDNQWHVRWILRERAIILAGRDPKALMQLVSTDVLRTRMQSSIEKLRSHFVPEIDKPLGWFNTRFGQSFTVLTCCRMLHAFQSGGVASKRAAVLWAEQSLDAEWRGLIRQAWPSETTYGLARKFANPLT